MHATVPDRLKLPVTFSPQALQADLDSLRPSDWIDHFVTANYNGDWSILPLRGPQGAEHPIQMAYSDPTCVAFEDTPYLQSCDYFQEVLASFPFELRLSDPHRVVNHGGDARVHLVIDAPAGPEVANFLGVKLADGVNSE